VYCGNNVYVNIKRVTLKVTADRDNNNVVMLLS